MTIKANQYSPAQHHWIYKKSVENMAYFYQVELAQIKEGRQGINTNTTKVLKRCGLVDTKKGCGKILHLTHLGEKLLAQHEERT